MPYTAEVWWVKTCCKYWHHIIRFISNLEFCGISALDTSANQQQFSQRFERTVMLLVLRQISLNLNVYLSECCIRFLHACCFCCQAKRTKKVGIVGKYGTRYGASLRKMVKKIEISQHAKYTCSFCGKVSRSTECGWLANQSWFNIWVACDTNFNFIMHPDMFLMSFCWLGMHMLFDYCVCYSYTQFIISDQDEEEGCGYLALWGLQKDRSWRSVDLQVGFILLAVIVAN